MTPEYNRNDTGVHGMSSVAAGIALSPVLPGTKPHCASGPSPLALQDSAAMMVSSALYPTSRQEPRLTPETPEKDDKERGSLATSL